jgi:hypothetical protein
MILVSLTVIATYYFPINLANEEQVAPPPPPELQVFSPQNVTYQTTKVPLNITANNSTEKITYTLDGKENVTVIENATIERLSEGVHNITVYAFDNEGKPGDSENITFTVQLPYEPTTKSTPEQVVATINYFESEGLRVELRDTNRPQDCLNMGAVNLQTKEALATFAHQQGIQVIYQFNNPNSVVFSAYSYKSDPTLPTIYFIYA